ncbi:MAG: hypothetical protein AAGU21_18000 [Solidesulfovibrio sp.]|uniref:hypothetical protein n=1 Tax=Solidesulfovibrio sp. TaxID=2910990 RepID=UPI002B218EC0|nr:hypothetical protein [Solidesulfovibrio sp.]MEA4856187.1 hypothetical protein [Solidesulfovibrio sp.]
MQAERTTRCPGCGIEFNVSDIAGLPACPVCERPFVAAFAPIRANGLVQGLFTANAFLQPETGRLERIDHAWLWTLLFGCFYFATKGARGQAWVSFFATLFTAGLAWLVYPFFAARLLRRHYVRAGWEPVSVPAGGEADPDALAS